MSKSHLRAALVALTLALASAGAANAQVRGAGNDATVDQSGRGHAASIVQNGRGNEAALGQAGANNTGAIGQYGDNNDACLYQHGRNLSGGFNQIGHGQRVAYIQTRMGLRPMPIEVCRAQVAAGSPRDIVIPANVRMRRSW